MDKDLLLKISLPMLILSGCSTFEKEVPKPNILWITIEDTSPQFIGCYGNKDARTPVIDQLAAEGIRFTNAFSTGTVCSPSRTAIITGVKTYKAGTGNHRSKYRIPDFIKGFPYYLQQAGYYTSNNVKTDYNVFDEAGFIKEAWNECSDSAGWWNRKPGQPFFAVHNYIDSHQSRTMTESYQWYQENVLGKLSSEEQISENEFSMPPIYRDSPEMRKHHARVYNSLKLTDKKIGQLLARLEKDGLRDSTIIFFYADHGEGIPRGKTNGINLGYRVPFIIWFPEMYKHLSPWGKAGAVSDELIDFTDLAPTIISLAQGEVPAHLTGRKLIGKQRSEPASHLVLSSDRSDNGIDMVRTVTDGKYVYSRNFMPFIPELRYIRYMEIGEIKQQMRQDLKEGKLNQFQKSMFEDRPAEFLYDIENDTWETKNLAADPQYQKVLEKMRNQLNQEAIVSRDVMFLPEYEIAALSDSTNAYEARLNSVNYPIEKIYAAASLSGFRGKNIAAKQVDLLNDSNRLVRYWAFTGLLSQSKSDLASFKPAIEKAMNDGYPPVEITASVLIWNHYGSKPAFEKLKKYCLSSNNQLALQAIYYLIYSESKEPFIETIKAARAMDGRTYEVRVACMDFLGSLGLVPNDIQHRE
jgi:arylsulfatase A-like enzyme